MIQLILVISAFTLSIAYLGKLVYQNFFSKEVHCPGCSGCSTIDFSSIEKQLDNKFNP